MDASNESATKRQHTTLFTVAALLVALLTLITLGDAPALIIVVIIVGLVVLRGYLRLVAVLRPLVHAAPSAQAAELETAPAAAPVVEVPR